MTVTDFDAAEDMLIIDVPVTPKVAGDLPNNPISLQVELLPFGEPVGTSTLIRVSIDPDGPVSLSNSDRLDPDARHVILEGVAPADVDIDSIRARAVSDGLVVSAAGFPNVDDHLLPLPGRV